MDHITTFTLPGGGPSFDMVRVPGGKFMMGSPVDEPERSDDETQHLVEVSSFSLGKFLVTQELWKALFSESLSQFRGDKLPEEAVSWFDAVVFCNALSIICGKQPCYRDKNDLPQGWNTAEQNWSLYTTGEVWCDFKVNGFRLPTEAEWEYAARGGPFALGSQASPEKGYLYAGSDQLEQVGWFAENSGKQTREVGLLLPNALCLYDMSGNVYEWCNDWYGDYETNPNLDPYGSQKGTRRLLRGGSWNRNSRLCRVASRVISNPDNRGSFIGFRIALQ
jgi:formylglycine-generating enzyme